MVATQQQLTPSNQCEAPVHTRYAFKPLRGSSHWWALSQLAPAVAGKSVLDVGAGSGWLGQALRQHAPGRTVAIEIDTRSHPVLHSLYDQVLEDPTALDGQSFDFIALLDVLEHLPKPIEYLKRLRRLLAPSGTILLSVPNVAHWSVRFPLFFLGRFEYRPLGILDQTHLQFFTRQSFIALCKSIPDSHLKSVSASIEPLELALPRWIWSNPGYQAITPARQTIAMMFPGLMAYQHLAVITASDIAR
jgi:SAM-dependent methyltransferase